MSWRITHFDRNGQRHQLVVDAANNTQAMALVEQLYGEAMQIRAILLGKVEAP